MAQAKFTFPSSTASSVAALQSVTTASSFLVLNGTLASLNNFNIVSASSVGLSTPVSPGNGIARPVTIFATTSATGVVFTVIGKDLLGNVITATIVGASGGSVSTATDINNLATTSGTDFAQVIGIKASATIANIAAGFGPSGETQWLENNIFANPFAMSISVITVTSQPVTVQDTQDNPNFVTSPTTFNQATLVAVTANQESNYAFPVPFTRAIFAATGQASGPAVVYFTQAGI